MPMRLPSTQGVSTASIHPTVWSACHAFRSRRVYYKMSNCPWSTKLQCPAPCRFHEGLPSYWPVPAVPNLWAMYCAFHIWGFSPLSYNPRLIIKVFNFVPWRMPLHRGFLPSCFRSHSTMSACHAFCRPHKVLIAFRDWCTELQCR